MPSMPALFDAEIKRSDAVLLFDGAQLQLVEEVAFPTSVADADAGKTTGHSSSEEEQQSLSG